jgi:hypothetical protein
VRVGLGVCFVVRKVDSDHLDLVCGAQRWLADPIPEFAGRPYY